MCYFFLSNDGIPLGLSLKIIFLGFTKDKKKHSLLKQVLAGFLCVKSDCYHQYKLDKVYFGIYFLKIR